MKYDLILIGTLPSHTLEHFKVNFGNFFAFFFVFDNPGNLPILTNLHRLGSDFFFFAFGFAVLFEVEEGLAVCRQVEDTNLPITSHHNPQTSLKAIKILPR